PVPGVSPLDGRPDLRSLQSQGPSRGGIAFVQELPAPPSLGILAGFGGRAGQRGERPEEASVGSVRPRHRSVTLPTSAAKLVQTAVVAGAGEGIARHGVSLV